MIHILVVEITAKPKDRPPILDLDEKLIKSLKAIRAKGVVNIIIIIHVIRAATDALIASKPSPSMHLQNFSKPRSWVCFTTTSSSRTVQ